MSATLRLRDQSGPVEFTGKSVDSIIRREFGQKARLRPSADSNSPEAGLVVYPARGGGWNVLATALAFSGADGLAEREQRDYILSKSSQTRAA